MSRKQRRLLFIGAGLAMVAVSAGLVLNALQSSIVFFFSPTEVLAKDPGSNRFRLGGLVEDGSLKRHENAVVTFAVTDTNQKIAVRYQGLLPDLFREGQGVVAEGKLSPDGVFVADTVLAKHDENYMPPEVADALKKQGVWKDGGETGSPR